MDNEETSGLDLGLNALFDEDENTEDTSNTVDEQLEEIENNILAQTEDLTSEIANISESHDGKKRLNIAIEQLYPSHYQPRRGFDQNAIEELAESIKEYGVLQPLLVFEDPKKKGEYGIIAGERRWHAAQIAQIHEMPVTLLELSDVDAYKIALIENLQREDLCPIEEALGYKRLIDQYEQTQDGLAKTVGKSRPHVANMMRLLNLPDNVQAYVSSGELSIGHARALITSDDSNALAEQVVAKGLSVRDTEKLVSSQKKTRERNLTKPSVNEVTGEVSKDADTLALENDMSNALGMNVTIDSKNGKTGKLNIEFNSLDQLDEILHRLAHHPSTRLSG